MIRPYIELMRIHKPAGWFLFLWPSIWGLTMAAYKQRTPYNEYAGLVAGCLFGSFIMRSSACTVNDIFDRKLDASVERTKSRPLPSGRISVFAASLFLVFQFAVGIVFFAAYNKATFWTAVIQMIPMLCLYPLMKRVTYWPQAWLGLAINFGFPVSWFSVGAPFSGYMSPNTVTHMLFGLWCWTMVYDTIYGCQDRKDDIKAGIWSTAVLFGENTVPVVKCFAIGFVASLYASGVANGQGIPYFVVCVCGATAFLIWQFAILDVKSSPSCWKNFRNNAYYLGAIVYTGLFLDYVRVMT